MTPRITHTDSHTRRALLKRLGSSAAGAAGAVLLSGCNTLSHRLNPEPPEVSLIDLKPVKFGLLQQEFQATLQLLNPNDFDLDIRAMRFALEINEQAFASGISNAKARVPANSTANMDVTFSTGLGQLLRQVMQLDSDELSYRLSGTVKLTGLSLTLPFEKTGEVALPVSLKRS